MTAAAKKAAAMAKNFIVKVVFVVVVGRFVWWIKKITKESGLTCVRAKRVWILVFESKE